MAYVTVDDLTAAFGLAEVRQLAATASGSLDEDKAAAFIDKASAEVDSYAATRYAVPLDADRIPDHVKQVTLDITRFRMWGARSSEEVRKRYDDALRWLRDLAGGKVALIDASGLELPARSEPLSAAGAVAVAQYPAGGKWGSGFEQRQPGYLAGIGPFGGG